MLKIAVIGIGTIGSEIVQRMREKSKDEVYTIDIDKAKNPNYTSLPELYENDGVMDVYIITVLTSEQVLSIIEQVDLTNNPLISIETTCIPGTYAKARDIVGDSAHMITFPDRIYPNDEFHGMFNQKRLMGGDWVIGRDFYLRYIIYENIIPCDDIELVETCKLVENSYRYINITAAEELKMLLGDRFEMLRELINTKWNIDLPEARGGIGGVCLPKDIRLFNNTFPDNKLFRIAESVNKEYEEWLRDGQEEA